MLDAVTVQLSTAGNRANTRLNAGRIQWAALAWNQANFFTTHLMPIRLYAHLWTASSSLWLKGAAKDKKVGQVIDSNGSSEWKKGGRVGGLSHRTEVLEQCPRKGCARPNGIHRHTHTWTCTERKWWQYGWVVTHCSCKKTRGTDCCDLTEHVCLSSSSSRDIRGRVLSLLMFLFFLFDYLFPNLGSRDFVLSFTFSLKVVVHISRCRVGYIWVFVLLSVIALGLSSKNAFL